MPDIFGMLLWPLKWVIEVILVAFHWLFSTIGMNPASGVTWVIAIVFLTFVVRAALIPLFVRQIKSQRKMLEISPELKRIQDKYKGKKDQYSREAMSRETMALYSRNGTNPFMSCLPLIIQMPVFWALYQVLIHAASPTNAADPSDPANGGVTANIGLMTPQLSESFHNATFLGAPLHASLQNAGGNVMIWVLAIAMIVIMSGAQFITQLQIMSKNQTPEMKASPMYKQQRVLLYILPFVFVFSAIAFPLSSMFYWVASNLWTVAQQWLVIRNMPTPGSEAALAREARLARRAQRMGIVGPEDGTDGTAVATIDGVEPPKPKPVNNQRQQPSRKNRKKR